MTHHCKIHPTVAWSENFAEILPCPLCLAQAKKEGRDERDEEVAQMEKVLRNDIKIWSEEALKLREEVEALKANTAKAVREAKIEVLKGIVSRAANFPFILRRLGEEGALADVHELLIALEAESTKER
jgi:hypothetical protein